MNNVLGEFIAFWDRKPEHNLPPWQQLMRRSSVRLCWCPSTLTFRARKTVFSLFSALDSSWGRHIIQAESHRCTPGGCSLTSLEPSQLKHGAAILWGDFPVYFFLSSKLTWLISSYCPNKPPAKHRRVSANRSVFRVILGMVGKEPLHFQCLSCKMIRQ